MKTLLTLAVIGMVICGASNHIAEGSEAADNSHKILIAFFSKTNNTKIIAEQIQSLTGGDMFHVATKKPYPADYRETTQIARIELDNNERPELNAAISAEEMGKYDVIFLGYPNWWGTIPMVMFTFLEQYDMSGKKIVPFCTHGGSGLGRGPSDIARLAPNADILKGFAIRGDAVSRAQNDIINWLRGLGYTK